MCAVFTAGGEVGVGIGELLIVDRQQSFKSDPVGVRFDVFLEDGEQGFCGCSRGDVA